MRGKFSGRSESSGGSIDPSMRPAHYAREVFVQAVVSEFGRKPSMRPAHYAREVGKPVRTGGRKKYAFNEARALCAGSCCRCGFGLGGSEPSMRPAHYAREVDAHEQLGFGAQGDLQ